MINIKLIETTEFSARKSIEKEMMSLNIIKVLLKQMVLIVVKKRKERKEKLKKKLDIKKKEKISLKEYRNIKKKGYLLIHRFTPILKELNIEVSIKKLDIILVITAGKNY